MIAIDPILDSLYGSGQAQLMLSGCVSVQDKVSKAYPPIDFARVNLPKCAENRYRIITS